eukprot:scaffold17955_cov31-Tisochrysis_lutea.AAC.1
MLPRPNRGSFTFLCPARPAAPMLPRPNRGSFRLLCPGRPLCPSAMLLRGSSALNAALCIVLIRGSDRSPCEPPAVTTPAALKRGSPMLPVRPPTKPLPSPPTKPLPSPPGPATWLKPQLPEIPPPIRGLVAELKASTERACRESAPETQRGSPNDGADEARGSTQEARHGSANAGVEQAVRRSVAEVQRGLLNVGDEHASRGAAVDALRGSALDAQRGSANASVAFGARG